MQYADGLVVGTTQNLIRLSDAVEPTVEWQTPISNIKRILGATDEIIVVKTQDEIRGFAINSGEEVIEPIPNDGLVAASVDNLIVSGNTLYQIESSATVTELSTISAPRFVNQPVVGDDALYAAGGNREIVRIGASSQEIEWKNINSRRC